VIMAKLKNVLVLFLLATTVVACKKDVPVYDVQKHLQEDEAIIQKYLTDNNLLAEYQKDGDLYYKVIKPGEGADISYAVSSLISVNYEGKLLGNATPFDKSSAFNETTNTFDDPKPITFPLTKFITGFQLAVVRLKKGGLIKVIIPSPYAYGPDEKTNIPANSILTFTIELTDVQ
jgi:FKBP-type peptidyl-prolyl cis-trans isomerase FkpA